tara:strand:- start:869 stop:1687 length:819 start_codon:yes stop_codon:yes gene_type:complete
MANWDGQIARHGITVQGFGRRRLEPGWMSSYVRDAVGVPNSMNAALDRNGVRRPILASQLPDGESIFVHDLHRGYTRYPRNRGQTINMSLDTNLSGYNAQEFSVDLSIMNVARYSDRGLDKGATRAWIHANIKAWDLNGNLWLDFRQLGTTIENSLHSNRQYAISGWTPFWHPWEMFFYHSPGIGRVVVHTRIFTGGESYHSVGDRSNGGGWNPTETIGRYHQYRYTDLIGINEGGSWNNPLPPIEYERRMVVDKRATGTSINVISERKNHI